MIKIIFNKNNITKIVKIKITNKFKFLKKKGELLIPNKLISKNLCIFAAI